MKSKSLAAALLLTCFLVLVYAGTKIALQINGKKVDIAAQNDSRNPYLYNTRLRDIQAKLNKVLSFNLTNYAPIEENGFYNKETEAALEQFREMYYKKYSLQRYYAFSAEDAVEPSSVEGLLDREIPAAADFAREYQEGMKLKNGDPAKYYGNSAWDEVLRIEKGMDGDTVDPVTGELSKTIPLYQTPAGNDHLMPIQLTARYGSQYSGNCGLGDNWYLTESYSLWFSYEKNEMIVQDGSGISQKFNFTNGGFSRDTNNNTDGGLFLNVMLDGALGTEGSTICVITARGETMIFECADNKGQDSVSNVIESISTNSLEVYGYCIVEDLRIYEVTNYTRDFMWSLKTNISVSNYGPTIKMGLYADSSNALDMTMTNSAYTNFSDWLNNGHQTVTGQKMICDKEEFKNKVWKLSDTSEGGWSVSYYAAPLATNAIEFVTNWIWGGAPLSNCTQSDTNFDMRVKVNTNIVYTQGTSYSFRRQPMGQAGIYAGYVLTNSMNRFGSVKSYSYDGFQKLLSINSYSPGGTEIDGVSITYSPAGEKGFIKVITTGLASSANGVITFSYTGNQPDHQLLDTAVVMMDGKADAHRMAYHSELLFGPGSPDGVKLSNSIFSNYSALTNSFTYITNEISFITSNIGELVQQNYVYFWEMYTNITETITHNGINTTTNISSSLFYDDKYYNNSKDYYDLLVQFMESQLPDLISNISSLTDQISNYNSGDLFPRLALLDSHIDSAGPWQEYRYGSFDTNMFGVTNRESAFRTTIVRKQGAECRLDYSGGYTEYHNFSGNTFKFHYDINQTNYDERHVDRIVYPDNSTVSFGYDKKGNITAVTNEINNAYSYGYDDFGNVTNKSMPGRNWYYEYNSVIGRYLGRPTKIVQPDHTVYTMAYDENGEMTNQTLKANDADQGKTLVQVFFSPLSANGFVKTNRDMYGSETVYTYDGSHSPVSVKNPDGGVTAYINDSFGKPLIENRSNLVTNICVYDSRGNIVEQGIAGLNHSFTEYDAAGRRLSSTDPMSNKTIYEYGAGNSLAGVIFPSGEEVRYSYDGDGNKTNEAYYAQSGFTIANKSIVYAYDPEYRLTNKALVQDGETFNYSFQYDAAGNMTLQTAESVLPDGNVPAGVSNSYAYDAISILTNQSDLISGKNISYYYDPMGRLTFENRTVTNGSGYGFSLSNTYDILGRNTASFSFTNGAAVIMTSNDYQDNDRVTVKIDRYGNQSVNYMDFRNNVTNLQYSVFNPLTEENELYTHSYIYDTLGNKTEEIYPDGTRQKWQFVFGNRLLKESGRYSDESAAAWKTYSRDAAGRVTAVNDFENKTWGKSYNSLGRLSSETDPDGRQIFYITDLWGNPMTVQQGSRRRDISYNILNKPVTVNYGDGAADSALYDAMGNVVQSMPGGASNLQTVSRYDNEGKKTYEAGFGLETYFAYDAQGNLIYKKAATAPSNHPQPLLNKEGSRTWTYAYDACGRITEEHLPDGTFISHDYAVSNGLLIETVSGPKRHNTSAADTTVNTYDQMDRLIRSQVCDDGLEAACDIGFFAGKGLISGKVFDRAGLPVKEVRPGNKIKNYKYSPEGRVTNEENEAGEVKSSVYDKNGNLTYMTDFDGNSFSNTYYNSGKLMKSLEPGNAVTSYYYDAYGNMNKKVLPDGSTWLFETDARGRTVKETNPFGGTAAFEYDALGRKMAETGPGGSYTAYDYDGNGIPTGIETQGNDGENAVKISAAVDGFGETNRVEYPTTPSPSSGKEGSQGLIVTYQYDNMGRVTNKTTTPNPLLNKEGSRTTRYKYREDGRLKRTDNPDGTAEMYAYSAAWLLTNRTVLGDTNKGDLPPKRVTAYYYGGYGDGDVRPYVSTGGFGDVECAVDYRGIVTASYYDKAGRLTNRSETAGTEPRNTITIYGLTNINNLFYRTMETWKEETHSRASLQMEWSKTVTDFRGNVLKVYRMEKGQELLTADNTYNAAGKLVSEVRQEDLGSPETRYEYGANGALSKKTEPSGLITEYSYDSAGRITETREYPADNYSQARKTDYQYHQNGRLKRKVLYDFSGPALEDTSYSYDFRGNVINKTDNLRNTAFITFYNAYGEKTEESTLWNGESSDRHYSYDAAGRLYQTTGELGSVTTYTYGDFGQTATKGISYRGDVQPYVSTSYFYDSRGNVITETVYGMTPSGSPSGKGESRLLSYTTSYQYDGWGNRTNTVYPDGSFETSEYDGSGQKINETDRYGYRTAYEYDENGRETKRTSGTPNGNLITETVYDNSGRKISETSHGETGPSRTAQYQYDSSGRLINQQIGDVSSSTGYDAFGNKTWTTTPGPSLNKEGSSTWYYQYDAAGRTTVSIDGEGNRTETSYGFDGDWRLTVTTTPNPSSGKEGSRKIIYDGFGNKIEDVDANGNSEYYQYNAAGKPTVYTDRNSNQTVYIYDSLGRQTATVDANGSVLSNVYDSFNNIIEVVDKEGRHLYREFDWAGRMIWTKDALGNEARYEYTTTPKPLLGKEGNPLGYEVEVFTDAEGNKATTYKYGKMTLAVQDALGNITSYQYNAFGELTATVDPKGNTTSLTYDLRGNKTGETTALGFSTTYQYDNNGNVINEINGEGWIKTTYNRNNQPVRKDYSDGNTKNFLYDSLGRLTRARDNFSDYSYLYDNNGSLTNRYDNINKETLAYEYDGNGNRVKMTAQDKIVNYDYDALNQIKKETVLTTKITKDTKEEINVASGFITNLSIDYSYSPMGRVTNKTYSSGLVVNYEYDPIYRLMKINNTTNGLFLSSFGYTYDKVGNRTKETARESTRIGTNGDGSASGGERVSAFLYDKAYRLVKADYSEGKFEEFEYDNSGNRLRKTSNLDGSNTVTTGYVIDNDNRLLCEQKPSGNISFIYDRAGRIIKKVEGDKVERYQYNQRDLMTKYTVEQNGSITSVSEYTYDINNLRTVKKETPETPGSVGDNTTRFTYDGDNILYEGPSFYLNNIFINSYEAEIQPLRTAVYVKDALGSVRGEIYDNPLPPVESGGSGIALKEFNYTAFGEMLAIGDQIAIDNDAKKGISYTGHYFDKDTKLYYARARYYDPGIGRFITSDPIQDPSKRYAPAGLNRYVYGDNSPLRYIDPEGQFGLDDLIAGIVGGIIGAISNVIADIASGDYKDILLDSILGSTAGFINGVVEHYGIPMYISFNTRGFGAGVGYNLGGVVSVGAGIHSDWSGQNYGFSVNAGLGGVDKYKGLSLGFSAGIDYGPEGQKSYFGFNAGAGSINFGANWNYVNGQYAGFGVNGGFGGDIGKGYSLGLNLGANFDAKGNYSGGSAGINIGYNERIKDSKDSMQYNGSLGINFSADGKVTPYANFTATRCINIQKNAETGKKAGNKTANEIEMERQGLQRDMAERMKTTVMSMEAGMERPETPGMMVIGQSVNDANDNQTAGDAMTAGNEKVAAAKAAYNQEKQQAIQNGTLGQFYKREMLENLTFNQDTGYWVTTIDGQTINIGRTNIDLDFSTTATYTLDQSKEHIYTVVSNMTDDAIIGFANFTNHNEGFVVTSMWRNTNDPHGHGTAFDMVFGNNTPVYAAEGGIVTTAGNYGGAGIMITISGTDNLKYTYMHNNQLYYSVNANVDAGNKISLSGGTPNYAPHLHFQIGR